MIGGAKVAKARIRQNWQDQLDRKVFALRNNEWDRFDAMPGMSRRDKLLYLIATAEAMQALRTAQQGIKGD